MVVTVAMVVMAVMVVTVVMEVKEVGIVRTRTMWRYGYPALTVLQLLVGLSQ